MSVEAVEIPLSTTRRGSGLFALVDVADSERVWLLLWHPHGSEPYIYAKSAFAGEMHRYILGVTDPNVYVDHANGDGLDNRRANLRLATNSQNNANTTKTWGKSPHRGVYLNQGRWVARIKTDGKSRYLGGFATEDDAARAWNAAALEQWGSFAVLNTVEGR